MVATLVRQFHDPPNPREQEGPNSEGDVQPGTLSLSGEIYSFKAVQFSSVQSLSHVRLFATP